MREGVRQVGVRVSHGGGGVRGSNGGGVVM